MSRLHQVLGRLGLFLRQLSERQPRHVKTQRRPAARFEQLEPRLALAADVLSFPHIADQTVLGGAPLWLGIDATDTDANGDPLTYSVSVSNPNLLYTAIPTGNKSLQMNVAGYGQMTFQLFDNLAPRTTQHIESLVNKGDFNTTADSLVKWYRVAHFNDGGDFVIQAGPQNSVSSLGQFDDEYNLDLQFTSSGLLGMAKSTDDTNDNQVFVSGGAERFLDFQHSIFGILTEGESVRQAIQHSRSSGDGSPPSDIIISNSQIITDTQNAALELKASEAASGQSDVTLTVSDQQGHQYSQTFHVTVTPDTANSAPFLNPIAPVTGVTGQPITVQLTAQDAENNPADRNFFAATKPAGETVNYAVSANSSTGLVTITPPAGFAGTFHVIMGVRGTNTTTTADAFDQEIVFVTVAPSASTNLDLDATPTFSSTAPTAGQVGVNLNYDAQTNEEGGTSGLVYSLTSAPAGATINPSTGVITWTPTSGQAGIQSFNVVATDAAGNTATQPLSIVVAAASVELTLTLTKPDGSPLTKLGAGDDFVLHVFAKDVRSDPHGVFAAYMDIAWDSGLAVAAGPLHFGSRYFNGQDGSTATPGLLDEAGAFTGSAELGRSTNEVFSIPMRAIGRGTLTFTANPADSHPAHDVLEFAGSATAVPLSEIQFGTATVEIGGTFQAVSDTFSVNEDAKNAAIAPLANDNSFDGNVNTLTISAVGPTDHGGLVTISAGGTSLRYTPAANFNGTETFTYSVHNQSGETHTATITVQVAAVNDPPTAANDSFTVFANSGDNYLDVLVNDGIAPDVGEVLRIAGVGSGNHGGRITVSGATIVYAPAPNFVGTESFTYTIRDRATGGLADQATVTVLVSAPPAAPDTITVQEDAGPISLDVLANDPANSHPGSALNIVDVGVPSGGGSVSISPDGTRLIYAAAANFSGTETFNYGVANALGAITFATVRVNVLPAADPLPGVIFANGVLQITGTPKNDTLSVNVGRHRLQVSGMLGQTRINQTFNANRVQQIVADLNSGNDFLTIQGNVRIPLFVDAGDGNDTIFAGGGWAVLIGGNGNDMLFGGSRRDVIIGGAGQDQLFGNGGSDLLIGGTTSFDQNQAALVAIQSEWNSRASLPSRMANLRSGSGPFLAPLGVSLQADQTVFNDADVDSLFGGGDLDWFFADPTKVRHDRHSWESLS